MYVDDCTESDYYTAVDTGGACNGGPSGAGAYAGLLKTMTMCLGGSCDAGGSLVYQTTYQYDPHRRACSVQTLDPAGQAILASSYVYDQYDNVISETHSSELDASAKSNYQIAYAYDGLLRLIGETRTDAEDALIERTTYAYDARSNLIEKVQQRPVTGTGPPPTLTPTAPTVPTATGTTAPTPTAGGSVNGDDSCAIQPRGGGSWIAASPPALLLLLRRRRGRRHEEHGRSRRHARCSLLLLPALDAPGAQELSTTTTRYTYNDDGALTQVVEQVDDNAPTTTYLTWDNFVPDAADPTTGTVLPGNGNLVAVGPAPGVDVASRSFAFDAEDRLTGYTDANGSVSYRFHPTWLLASSTLDGGDTRYFYFDGAETAADDQHRGRRLRADVHGNGVRCAASATAACRSCSARARTSPESTTRRRAPSARIATTPSATKARAAPRRPPTISTTTRTATRASTRTRPGAATTCARAGTTRSCTRSSAAIRWPTSTATTTPTATR